MDLRIGICDDAPDWREKTRETVKFLLKTEIKNIQVMTVKKFFLKSISCWRRERVQKLKKLILKRSR